MMNYEGIGAVSATFEMSGAVVCGQVCKISGNGTVSACSADDSFHGVVHTQRGESCGVLLHGAVCVGYSGDTAPGIGWETLLANGSGGVIADEDGDKYLVLSVNTTDKTAVVLL